MIVDFFIHAPDRETYAAVIPTYVLPDGRALGRTPGEGETPPDGNALIYPEGVAASEIGAIGDVPGYHVNMLASGAVAAMLTAGRPAEGTLFERTHILGLIEGLEWAEAADGVPAGYVGPNGIRIIDPAEVATPARVWG